MINADVVLKNHKYNEEPKFNHYKIEYCKIKEKTFISEI